MCIATFVAILDTSVVNLALHAIKDALHASVTALQWTIDAYNLIYAAFIMTGGALGDLFGRRRIFVIGMVLFTAGSVVCALAPNMAVLIAGRGLAGLGAAFQLPGALSILNVTFPDADARAHAISIWGGFNGFAMAIGPTVGGLCVAWLGWQSVFWLVVPFGVVAIALAQWAVPESSDPHGRRLDPAGQILAVLCLGTLAFAFIQAPSLHWSSPWIIACVVLCLASFVTFVLVERRVQGPLVDLALFRNRAFSAAIGDAALMTFGMYAFLFIFPLYLQSVRGFTPTAAGLMLVPMSLSFFLVSLVAGRLLQVVGARVLITGGLSLTAAGVALLAFQGAQTGVASMIGGLLAIGIGLGLITGPIMTVAVSGAPRERSGTSSWLVNVGRMIGATFGVATLGSVFGAHIGEAAQDASAFLAGMRMALAIGAAGLFAGALITLAWLPGAKRAVG
jgi:EmrB/QacA subfamily drug resistance transporter